MRSTIGWFLLASSAGCFAAGDDVDLDSTAQSLTGLHGVSRFSRYDGASAKRVDLECPVGQVGLGMSYGADDGRAMLDDVALTAEIVDERRWRVYGTDFSGAPSWSLWGSLACSDRPKMYELVTGTASGGDPQQLELECPVGTVAVGSAYAATSGERTPPTVKLAASMPAEDGAAWSATGRSVGGGDWLLHGTIVCIDPRDAPGYQVVITAGAPSTAPTQGLTAHCSGVALAGGWAALDEFGGPVDAAAYYDARTWHGWDSRARVDPSWTDPWLLEAAAICIN